MSGDTPTSDGELVERARRFDEHHPRAIWPSAWKDAALREVARLRAEVELQRVQLKNNAALYSAEVERLTEQGKQDAAIIDGLVGDLQSLDVARIESAALSGEVLAKLDAHKREATRLRDRVDEERAAKDEARKDLCRKVVMTARDLPVRVRRDDGPDAMCSDPAEVADAWGWGYLYPMTGPEFVEAAMASGEDDADLEREFGNDWIGSLSSDETDAEFVALATEDDHGLATPAPSDAGAHPRCSPTSHCGADDCPGNQADR